MNTTKGLYALNARLFSDEIPPFIFIGIGEGKKIVSDQDEHLDKEFLDSGMQRKRANVVVNPDGSVTLSAEFPCNKTAVISELGVFNENVGGTMLRRILVGPFNVKVGTMYQPSITLKLPEITDSTEEV